MTPQERWIDERKSCFHLLRRPAMGVIESVITMAGCSHVPASNDFRLVYSTWHSAADFTCFLSLLGFPDAEMQDMLTSAVAGTDLERRLQWYFVMPAQFCTCNGYSVVAGAVGQKFVLDTLQRHYPLEDVASRLSEFLGAL